MNESPPRFITPQGFARIRAEYDALFATERPKLVETISWAAANGDRSENGDYIYGRKRLREIDRRLAYLGKVMKNAKVVDPAKQASRDQVRFGATIELADDDDHLFASHAVAGFEHVREHRPPADFVQGLGAATLHPSRFTRGEDDGGEGHYRMRNGGRLPGLDSNQDK